MPDINLILGNLCSLLAMGTDSISSAQKTTKKVLAYQNLSQLLYATGTILLRGYSGAVQNFVSILRNLVAMRGIDHKWIQWLLAILGVVLGLAFNNLGLVGLLPVIANLQYTLVMFRYQNNERALKLSFLVAVAMFSVFNLAIWNLVGFVTNLIVLVTILIFLLKKPEE